MRRADAAHGHHAWRGKPAITRAGELKAADYAVAAGRRNQRRASHAAPAIEHQLGCRHCNVEKKLRVISEGEPHVRRQTRHGPREDPGPTCPWRIDIVSKSTLLGPS